MKFATDVPAEFSFPLNIILSLHLDLSEFLIYKTSRYEGLYLEVLSIAMIIKEFDSFPKRSDPYEAICGND